MSTEYGLFRASGLAQYPDRRGDLRLVAVGEPKPTAPYWEPVELSQIVGHAPAAPAEQPRRWRGSPTEANLTIAHYDYAELQPTGEILAVRGKDKVTTGDGWSVPFVEKLVRDGIWIEQPPGTDWSKELPAVTVRRFKSNDCGCIFRYEGESRRVESKGPKCQACGNPPSLSHVLANSGYDELPAQPAVAEQPRKRTGVARCQSGDVRVEWIDGGWADSRGSTYVKSIVTEDPAPPVGAAAESSECTARWFSHEEYHGLRKSRDEYRKAWEEAIEANVKMADEADACRKSLHEEQTKSGHLEADRNAAREQLVKIHDALDAADPEWRSGDGVSREADAIRGFTQRLYVIDDSRGTWIKSLEADIMEMTEQLAKAQADAENMRKSIGNLDANIDDSSDFERLRRTHRDCKRAAQPGAGSGPVTESAQDGGAAPDERQRLEESLEDELKENTTLRQQVAELASALDCQDHTDQRNIGSTLCAEKLLAIVLNGRESGVFGGEKEESAAQAILKLRDRNRVSAECDRQLERLAEKIAENDKLRADNERLQRELAELRDMNNADRQEGT